MKRKLLSLTTAMFVFLAAMPINTLAARQQTSGQTNITYTEGVSYTINIPASIDINSDPYIRITATDVNIPNGQSVCVNIDDSKTYENGGNFYLYKNKGTPEEERILCGLWVGSYQITGIDFRVCKFTSEGPDSNNKPLEIRPITGSTPGTYTGAIYFKISLE